MKPLFVCIPTFYSDDKGQQIYIMAKAMDFDEALDVADLYIENENGELRYFSPLLYTEGDKVYEGLVTELKYAWIEAIEKELDSQDEVA